MALGAVIRPGMPPLGATVPDHRPRFRYVVVDGPIGVGKTSLATLLAARWAMKTEFEQAADNPFLERFYRDTARYALATQLSFLQQRAQTMQRIAADDGAAIITDFMPQKDELFARLTLADDEFALYRGLAEHVSVPQRTPDLVIYLQASPETLFARIQRRALAMELQISDAYLRALGDAYDAFFYHYAGAPLLTVNTEHLNPVDDPADLNLLIERVDGMRGRKEFFVKGTQ